MRCAGIGTARQITEANHAATTGPPECLGAQCRLRRAHDDGTIIADTGCMAAVLAARQIAQADHATASGPAKRFETKRGGAPPHDHRAVGAGAEGPAGGATAR